MFSSAPVRPKAISRRRGISVALAIGLASGGLYFGLFPLSHGADFAQFHYHAHAWLSGRDPYTGGYPIMRATRVVPEPLFYPLPTVLAIAPFATLPIRYAGAAFIAISTAILAFALLRRNPDQLPLFLSAGFIVAAGLGQWTPLITATFLVPPVAWLAVLKPNVGLATTVANPTRIGIFGGGLLLAAALAIQPTWPREWIRNLHSMPAHPIPLLVPGGGLLLICLLRWRRPEARLVLAMACVPQLMYYADQLPLWLVPQTRRESMLLSSASLVMWSAQLITASVQRRQPAFASSLFVLCGVYLPATVMILRRPNAGRMPAAIEIVARRLPVWLRGQPEAIGSSEIVTAET